MDSSEGTSEQKVEATTPHRPLGLKQVYPDPSDASATAKTTIDIIAMHGLDAQSPTTWNAWSDEDDPTSGYVNWLADSHMLPNVIPYARILTYDWNANYDSTASSDIFLGHADSLLDRIDFDRTAKDRSEHPIIFVASCFSGLLLAKALVRANDGFHAARERYQRILHFTVGAVFLGTPFQSSWPTGYKAASLRVAVAEENGFEYSKELIEYLQNGTRDRSGPLDELVQRFCEMISHDAFKFNKLCVYETRHTKFSAVLKKLPEDYTKSHIARNGSGIVVSQGSACIQGCERIGLDTRHNMLHKFNSPDNDGFQRISSRLKRFSEQADDVLSRKNQSCHDVVLTRSHEVAMWLSTIDHAAQQGSLFSQRQPGSCQWFLDCPVFTKWAEKELPVLFCPGSPGTGKSVLSSIVVDHLKTRFRNDNTVAIGFAYGNDELKEVRDHDALLRSLARQLVERQTFVPAAVTTIYNDHRPPKEKPVTLDTIYDLFAAVAVQFKHVFIVVDALDEYDHFTQKKLISKLLDLQKACNMSLLVTTRPCLQPDIKRLFSKYESLEIRTNTQDILNYLESNAEQVLRSSIFENQRLRQRIIRTIADEADGMFRYVFFSLARLRESLEDEVEDVLNDISTSKPGPTDMALVDPLADTHRKVVAKITRQTEGSRELAHHVLLWLVCAVTPLTKTQLQEAISFKLGESPPQRRHVYSIEEIVCVCAGLVSIQERTGVVRLVHQATRKFLETKLLSLDIVKLSTDEGCLNTADRLKLAHRQIAQACITYLKLPQFQTDNPAQKADATTKPSESFYTYAIENWGHHVREGCMQTDDLVLSFLQDDTAMSAACMVIPERDIILDEHGKPRNSPGIYVAIFFSLKESFAKLHNRRARRLDLFQPFHRPRPDSSPPLPQGYTVFARPTSCSSHCRNYCRCFSKARFTLLRVCIGLFAKCALLGWFLAFT